MSPVNELPVKGSQFYQRGPRALNRRQALGLLATGIATGLAACSKPSEQIVPYVRLPEGIVPGQPLKFATTLPLSGFGRGVIVTSIDGRPIKVEGNPRHPASLGATDVFSEAAVLSLYDPDRSRTVLNKGAITSHDAFRLALQRQLEQMQKTGGEGFRLLTGHVTSPTMLRQIDDLLELFPKASWHAYEPIDNEADRAGAALAFGKPLETVPRLEKVKVLLTLDADPLGQGPDQLRNARGFASRRMPSAGGFSRIYSVEAAPTLTGAKADHRMALHPHLIGEVAIAIAHSMGAGIREAVLPEKAMQFAKQSAADLSANRGGAFIMAGRALSPQTAALVHWINARLHAPVDLIEPVSRTPGGREAGTLPDLTRALQSGAVDQFVVIGANPGYDAPADLEFAKHSAKAGFRLHVGRYVDETAALSTWHIPQTHDLEAWSDLRSIDGTASIVQPLIRPLYRTWTDHDVLALLMGHSDTLPYDMVRETWKPREGNDFEAWWTSALHDGVIAGSAVVAAPADPALPIVTAATTPPDTSMTIVLRPDPTVWDGTFANNAWLQECPKPLTKQVWGNALSLNPQEAAKLGLTSGDVVTLAANGRQVEAPVIVEPGVADGVISLTLGLGRRNAGAIGTGIGANAFSIRTSASPWTIPKATIAKTGRRGEILTTQNVVRTPEDVRELYPLREFSGLGKPKVPSADSPPSLLPERPRPDDGHAWAMVIDASVCIGCNACVVACQSENNVAVVGPEEVARGRDMHWLRVDVYDHGTAAQPKPGFQPVPCMHCEHAPCEPVCPVAASVHDGEGLNLQVYNRCVGTRFCEANCPYKVRRFNFFGYADGEEYANLGFESYRAQKNPEVTVRARGVMEKCTYCVQRISGARRAAEREDRPIGLDEVKTACQSACPTNAITFGDLHQQDSMVNRQKVDERHYALLGHLGTRPRTTYLADIRNLAPGFDEDAT
ncbi:MAG: 4Fe-4S dicluster domain-containing protein [Candidatus Dormibacteraeota bacterium]|nr:4Fe-4S dicluster domain-containing protein [Candidatus Dormibacteraeota bacterium]